MQRFLIETRVERAEGSQIWFVDAETLQEAIEKYEAGEADVYSTDTEVLQLGKPAIIGVTSLDDKGEMPNIAAQRDRYADLLRRVSACFTREDDLPDGLLPDIAKALESTG